MPVTPDRIAHNPQPNMSPASHALPSAEQVQAIANNYVIIGAISPAGAHHIPPMPGTPLSAIHGAQFAAIENAVDAYQNIAIPQANNMAGNQVFGGMAPITLFDYDNCLA
jgi:hypothetical protein